MSDGSCVNRKRVIGNKPQKTRRSHATVSGCCLPPRRLRPVETEATIEKIYAPNRKLIAAGARKFACGISPARNAKSLRPQPDGTVAVTDGPYTETKEHIGGFWILEAADLDEALAWARKGAVACRASGEVREILFKPDPKGATK